MRFYIIIIVFFISLNSLCSNHLKLVVGTHIKDEEKGLYFCQFNENTGKFTNKKKYLNIYGSSVVSQVLIDDYVLTCGVGSSDNNLSSIYTQTYTIKQFSSEGARPCYVSVSPNRKFLFTANIGGGSVSSFSFNKNTGEICFISKVEIPAKGKAFKPHAAVPSPDGRFLFVPDIAGSRINKISISSDGKLRYNTDIDSKKFKGPRHFCFDKEGKTAYLVNQTGEAVTIFRYHAENGDLEEIGHEQSLPDDMLDINNHISEIKIHPSGKFVYVANRGHDSLTLYERDTQSGLLKFKECTPSQGKAPWSFDITPNGKFILCSNNKTGNIAVFSVDVESGKLKFSGEVLSLDKAISSIKLFY